MKKFLLPLLLMSFALFLTIGCGGPPEPEPEEQIVTPEPPKEEVKPVEPEPEPEPEVVKISEADFQVVYFDFDKYHLVDSAKAALEHNAEVLKNNPSVIVKIEGHCDERGTVEYNLSLGEKRAKSAMGFIKDLGVAEGRMSTISYGKTRPADPRSNEAAWAKNRRCEFRIVSQ